ncbi:MAG: nucleotidyl transferase AbiEii/AbiGii toxin family protein [Erysipelotrichaceae bacterium]|nr:nucleotidyl transferase AbiEii/AbiGii toxin family protein [Erysipelotrichaceae bacterium]
MLTPEQLKGKIRNIAKEKKLSSQEILQMYLFERILERLSKSKYSENFILKGGFLIASMIGIDERTTMDIDTTVKGLPMDAEVIEPIIRDILSIELF